MKIALCYSMQYAEKAKEMQDMLATLGHTAYVSSENHEYFGKDDSEKEKIKLYHKYETDILNEYFGVIANADAILVLNYDKHGITNYIGGNTFLEMGIAYFLAKKIFLLNPIPDMPYYKTELIAMKPVVIDGDLRKIQQP